METYEKPLPNSPDAEKAILGSIILDNSLVAEAVETLRGEDFYVPSHREIFRAMLGLFEKGSEINPVLICELMPNDKANLTHVTNLTYGLPRSASLAGYTRIVREKAQLRQLAKVCAKVTSEVLEEEEEAERILESAESQIFRLRDSRQTETLARINTLADISLEAAEARGASKKPLSGLTTGFSDLDGITAGLQRTDLIVIAARPSVGKSSLGLNLAQNAAEKVNASVGYFSLEMSKGQLTDRLLCSMSRVDAHRYRSGFLSRDEWARLAGARNELKEWNLYIDDTAALSTLQLRAKARRLVSTVKNLDLLIVDYLQLMRGKAESRFQEVSQIARDLKDVAKELNVPLVALSQLSRGPEQRSDHRPMLSDLRESGEIEQAADLVGFIYREELYSRTEENAGVAEIILAKHRNGPTGTVRLSFLKEFTRFENMWRDYEPNHVKSDMRLEDFRS